MRGNWSNLRLSAIFLAIALNGQGAFSYECGETFGINCVSCSEAASCDGVNPTPQYTATCNGGSTCVVGSAGPCTAQDPLSTTENCGCKDPTDTSEIAVGSFIDLYNPTAYVECGADGTITFQSCGEDNYFSAEDAECTALPSCDGLVDGSYPILGNCGSYLSCKSNPITGTKASLEQCGPDLIFNFAVQDCEAAFVCDPTIGEYMDDQKCNMYHGCFGEDAAETSHCCAPGTIYDETTHTCILNDGSCNADTWSECLEDKYENQVCQVCSYSDEGFRYPTWLSCTDLYWECVANADESLSAVLNKCAPGTYYIGESDLCELAPAHPECSSTTVVGIDKYLLNY